MTAKVVTDPVLEVVDREQTSRFDDGPFPVDPFRFDRIEPWCLDWQPTGEDADSPTCLPDQLIVVADPLRDRPAAVPRGVIPDQHQSSLPACRQSIAAVGQERSGQRTDRATITETQQQFIRLLLGRAQQQTVTGERLGIGDVGCDRLLDEPQWLIGPSMERRLPHAGPVRSQLRSQVPNRDAAARPGSASRVAFFSEIRRIRTRNPVLGPLPGTA
jgi:hypothetical protein